jgi:hypothetical protein
MISTLREKILNWTPEKANEFHNHVARTGDYCNNIWETTTEGLYLYGASNASFYTTTGSSFHLKFGVVTDQLNILNKLSNSSKLLGLTDINCPSEITRVEIHGVPYTYWTETTPYGSNGIGLEDMSMFDPEYRDSSTIEFFKNLLKAIDDLIVVIDQSGETDRYYPKDLNVVNFFYDPLTKKYFWGTNLPLTATRQQSIDMVKTHVENFYEYSGVSTPNVVEELTTYVREKCKVLNLTI